MPLRTPESLYWNWPFVPCGFDACAILASTNVLTAQVVVNSLLLGVPRWVRLATALITLTEAPLSVRLAVMILSIPEVVFATRAWLAVKTPGYLAPPIEITLAELAGSPIARIYPLEVKISSPLLTVGVVLVIAVVILLLI